MPALPLNETQLADAARLKRAWDDYKKATPGASQEKTAAECGWKTQASFNQYLLGKIPLNLPALLKMCKAMGGINPAEISPTLSAQLPPANASSANDRSSNVTPLPAPRRAVDTLIELQALVDSLTPLLQDAGRSVLHKWLDGQASAAEAVAVLEQLQQVSAGASLAAENRAA